MHKSTASQPAPSPDDGPVRGHRRGSTWVTVTYGVHRCVEDLGSDPDQAPSHWTEADLAGWQLLMTGDGCFTGLTALAIWGVDLPRLPEQCPVFMAMGKTDPRPLRTGVVTSRHVRAVPYVLLRGLRVATVPEALVAAARWVGTVDLVALSDNALHRGLLSLEELRTISRSRRPGARELRRALDLMDRRAESLLESYLRILHVVCGIDVEPQWVVTHEGQEIARVDLWVRGTDSVHEYDGDEHEKARRRVKDLRRARRLDGVGLVRRGYTLGDLVHRPVGVLLDADRAVGRVHDPARIRAWTDLLRDSLYTPAGRAALLARLPVPSPRRRVAADRT